MAGLFVIAYLIIGVVSISVWYYYSKGDYHSNFTLGVMSVLWPLVWGIAVLVSFIEWLGRVAKWAMPTINNDR